MVIQSRLAVTAGLTILRLPLGIRMRSVLYDRLGMIRGITTLLVFVGCVDADIGEHVPRDVDVVPTNWQFIDATEKAGLSNFTHITGANGRYLLPETMGAGVGVFDYNQDGWPDIVLVNGGTWENNTLPALTLYRNLGDGTFEEVTEVANLHKTSAYGMGVTIGDYDNDGDGDIFLTTVGHNLLFENESGRFREVAARAGLADANSWSTTAVWFDADLDGWLDLYVGNYVEWSTSTDHFCSTDGKTKQYCTPELYEGEAGHFYHNNQDGTFSDWAERAGFAASPGKTLGAVPLDVNRDGWPDLAVANDTQRDELYINSGDGTFAERGVISGIAFDENGRPRAGMGIDAGILDQGSEPTIVIGNFSKEMVGVYHRTTQGRFRDRSSVSKIGLPSLLTLTFGLKLFDADLDGDLDLFTANGHIIPQVDAQDDGIAYKQSPHLFLNDGAGRFADVAMEIPAFKHKTVGRGTATLDYDRDGDLDIVMTENSGNVFLYENTAADAGRLFVTLSVEGNASNRNGYGTQLVAQIGDTFQYRTIRSGMSYLSHSEPIASFGLGAAQWVDTLVVNWPSGMSDTLRGIAANSALHLVEGTKPLIGKVNE